MESFLLFELDYYKDWKVFGSTLTVGPIVTDSSPVLHKALLAVGRAFASGGPSDGTLLENCAPTGWPALVTAASDAFEAAFGLQDSAVGSRIAANADLTADFDELTKLKGSLRHLVKNYTIVNTGAQAAWTSAAHVERPPKKKAPTQ